MTEGIIIRAVRLEDLGTLAAMYTHHWCDCVSDPDDRLLAGRYNVLIQLVRSPLALVAEQNGVVVGVCLGCRIENGVVPVAEEWVPAYEQTHALVLERAKTADEVLEGELFCDEWELGQADRYIALGSPYADAQITLFMVEPWLKNHGLGTTLFNRMRVLMREAGAKSFFLMSDSASDYTYYEHRGMELLHAYRQGSDDPASWDRASWAVLMYGGLLA